MSAEQSAEKAQPDWDRLGRETMWSRDDWIAAAMYLGDLDWRSLWPTVEEFVIKAGFSPISAARAVRESLSLQPSTGGGSDV